MSVWDPLVHRPNHIVERQRMVQSSTLPTYYRLPRSKLYVRSYYAAFGACMVGTVYGMAALIIGKPAAE